MSAQLAAELWGLSNSTVTKYYNKGRINAEKDSSGRWCIPITTIKPFSDEEIHNLLFITIQLKNKPNLEIDWSTINVTPENISLVYSNLCDMGFVEPFEIDDKQRIPYEVVLKNKGMEFALDFKKKKPNDYEKSLKMWSEIVIMAIKTYLEFKINS